MDWLMKLFNTSAAGGGIVNAPASKRFSNKINDSHRTITKHLGSNLMQRDSGNKLLGQRRREFYCRNGKTLVHTRTFQEAKKHINACGPGSWQKDLVNIYNAGALSSGDRNCCNQHDACYSGYNLTTGTSRIQNGRVSNKQCENEFSACMARQGSQQGRMFPTGVQMMSPNYYKSKRFTCK